MRHTKKLFKLSARKAQVKVDNSNPHMPEDRPNWRGAKKKLSKCVSFRHIILLR